jgi:Na+-translocating ferredoxin:NAD+ oxidoreductase subunit D
MPKPIEIRTSPHLKRALSVDRIMRNVVFALLPICAFAVFQFGLSALLLILTTTGAAIATEWFFARASGRGNTVSDWSVVITGILLALTFLRAFRSGWRRSPPSSAWPWARRSSAGLATTS